mgnify:FL=1
MNLQYLKQLLLTSRRLLMTEEAFRGQLSLCLSAAGTAPNRRLIMQNGGDIILPQSFFFFDEKTYAQETLEAFEALKAGLDDDVPPVTMDYSSAEVPDGSVAYHRIFGTITFDSRWYFSSRRFEQDLLAAEANPAITAHLLHINSGGGEAYYLDRLSETMRELKKPVVVLIEQFCASAAYYIGCHSTHIHALTANDTIGCIGTMVRVVNDDGWYEKNGIKIFDVNSSLSPLKNKMYHDMENGNTDEYVERVLDPLARQFIDEVRASRKQLSGLPDDDRLLQGDTFSTEESIKRGVIDGRMSMPEAIRLAHSLGAESRKANSFINTL